LGNEKNQAVFPKKFSIGFILTPSHDQHYKPNLFNQEKPLTSNGSGENKSIQVILIQHGKFDLLS